MTLNELRAALLDAGAAHALRLDRGVHVITQTLEVARSGLVIEGAPGCILRRGQLADGSLFKGPLVSIDGRRGVTLKRFSIEGARFASGRWFRRVDRFGCGAEADVVVAGSQEIEIADLKLADAVTIGVAIGPGCRAVHLRRMRIDRSGQFGVWMGAALQDRPRLPLPPEVSARLPCDVTLVDSRLSRCGAAAVFVEAARVALTGCEFDGNHVDFPFGESGGQLVIDYKASGVRVDRCRFLGCAFRNGLGAVAVEACGEQLEFVDLQVSGSAREAIHINGGRQVAIRGSRTRLAGNHRAPDRHLLPGAPRQDITVTTTAEMAGLGAVAADISVEDVRTEHGVLVWSNGSVPALAVDRVRVRGAQPLVVGANPDGSSVRGSGWEIG